MLTALTRQGTLINLADETRIQAKEHRAGQDFFCPICHESLILKAGRIRIPHFSHKPHSQCSYTSSEPESLQHLQGKKDIYRWCQANGLNVRLEHYLPSIQQRPDLFIERRGEEYAIEFQCTPIPVHSIQKRTSRYKEAGITPIWIVGGNPYSKRSKSQNIFYFTDYLWALTNSLQDHPFLLGYDPATQKMLNLSSIVPLTSRRVSAHLDQTPLADTFLPFQASTKQAPFRLLHWMEEKQKWLQKKVQYGNLKDPFLSAIYTSNNRPYLLPPQIGLPVRFMESFHSHPAEWQFYMWIDCLDNLKTNKKVSLKYIYYKLKKREALGHVRRRQLPLHNPDNWMEAVSHYFQLLESLFYFKRAGNDLYIKRKSFTVPKGPEEAILLEKSIYASIQRIMNRG